MKTKYTLLVITFIAMITSCSQEEVKPKIPTLGTAVISGISYTTATSGGIITSDGGSKIKVKGICWSTSPNPTTANDKTENGMGKDAYVSSLTNLLPNTQYFVRSYATNAVGTAYGDELNFTTNELGVPTLISGDVSNIGYLSAYFGASVENDGGSVVTAMGVCWSTSTSPTTNDFKTEFNNGGGFSGKVLTGLQPNTTYYVRSYAINSVGVGYGIEKSFVTKSTADVVTDIEGNEYHVVEINGKIWMTENLKVSTYNNGDPMSSNGSVDVTIEAEPKYYWFVNNNVANFNYGLLYTWYAANDARGVCPSGWKLPSYDDLQTLGTSAYALRETGTAAWSDSNGTNTTGFSAIGSGLRGLNGTFYSVNTAWIPQTSTSYNSNEVSTKTIATYLGDAFTDSNSNKKGGFPVRCIANE